MKANFVIFRFSNETSNLKETSKLRTVFYGSFLWAKMVVNYRQQLTVVQILKLILNDIISNNITLNMKKIILLPETVLFDQMFCRKLN